jgi:hypothetical protein
MTCTSWAAGPRSQRWIRGRRAKGCASSHVYRTWSSAWRTGTHRFWDVDICATHNARSKSRRRKAALLGLAAAAHTQGLCEWPCPSAPRCRRGRSWGGQHHGHPVARKRRIDSPFLRGKFFHVVLIKRQRWKTDTTKKTQTTALQRMVTTLQVRTALALTLLPQVLGHGAVVTPPPRNAVDRDLKVRVIYPVLFTFVYNVFCCGFQALEWSRSRSPSQRRVKDWMVSCAL